MGFNVDNLLVKKSSFFAKIYLSQMTFPHNCYVIYIFFILKKAEILHQYDNLSHSTFLKVINWWLNQGIYDVMIFGQINICYDFMKKINLLKFDEFNFADNGEQYFVFWGLKLVR